MSLPVRESVRTSDKMDERTVAAPTQRSGPTETTQLQGLPDILLYFQDPALVDAQGNIIPKCPIEHIEHDINAVGKSPYMRDAQLKMTPLGIAVEHGNNNMVGYLLEHGADPNRGMEDGPTPLHMATAGGKKRIAEMLIEAGAAPLST